MSRGPEGQNRSCGASIAVVCNAGLRAGGQRQAGAVKRRVPLFGRHVWVEQGAVAPVGESRCRAMTVPGSGRAAPRNARTRGAPAVRRGPRRRDRQAGSDSDAIARPGRRAARRCAHRARRADAGGTPAIRRCSTPACRSGRPQSAAGRSGGSCRHITRESSPSARASGSGARAGATTSDGDGIGASCRVDAARRRWR
jgi:hypothetical protein